MRIQYILHADFETPGILETWGTNRGFIQKLCRPFAGEALPSPSSYDLLILMGGPQDAYADLPYLKAEISLIQNTETPILGICLGAQIIGEALGAKTEKSPFKEVGTYPIHLTSDGKQDPLLSGLPASFPVIHWHGDMPGLTPESKILAASAGCPRQIIRYASHVYGFQCHLEPTRDNIQEMIRHCPHDLAPGPSIQSAEQLLAHDYAAMNAHMMRIMDRLAHSRRTTRGCSPRECSPIL